VTTPALPDTAGAADVLASTSPVLYASVSDLRLVLDSTDAGTGTAARLTDEQLTLALRAATNRVTTYCGEVYDSTAPTFPPIIADLTLDLAAWWATTYYSKQKEMGPNHPIVLRYTEAKGVLDDIRDGKVNIDFGGGVPGSSPRVINQIPNIFTPDDSNTRYDPSTGYLMASTPPDMLGRSRLLDDWGPY
jgi:hypothetical protein